MKIFSNVLISLSVCSVIGMVIAILNLLKEMKKNKDNSVESLVDSIKEFTITMAVLIVIEFTVNIINFLID